MSIRSYTLACASSLMFSLVAACATTEKPAGANIVVGPNGEVIALDENGNPTDDPALNALAALLGAEMENEDGDEGTAPQDLAEDEIWSVDMDGNFTHIQSGGMCPLEWSQFTLNKPIIFNKNGLDVGCSYLNQPLNSRFTFYFYKNAQPVNEEIVGIEAGIQARIPTAKPVTDVVTMPSPDGPPLYQVRMLESIGRDGTKTRDGVFLTDADGWRLKLRVTYPASRAEEIEVLAAYMILGQMDQISEDGIDSNAASAKTKIKT